MAKQLNVPDVHLYEIDLIDANGMPKKMGGRGVKGLRTEEEFLDHLRRHPAALNDDRGRPPRRFVGIRKVSGDHAAAVARYQPKLPPGLERNVAKAEGRDDSAVPGLTASAPAPGPLPGEGPAGG